MKKEEAEYFRLVIDSVHYDSNVFTVWYSEDKIIIGAFFHDNPKAQDFFDYGTIYNTILDTDRKIKFSIIQAADLIENIDFANWSLFDKPSESENLANYFTENAIFRIGVLWDLLAQLFNKKAKIGLPFDEVYVTRIFHNAQQGKHPDQFAKRVYAYMTQTDNLDVEPWQGNYKYVKDYRDKFTHRLSPSISAISNYASELRMPVAYVLKRVVEDYKQVSNFIQETISEIIKDYDQGDNHA